MKLGHNRQIGMNTMTYIINLVSRTDRLEIITLQMNNLGIDFKIWPAIKHENGRLGLILTMEQLFIHCLDNKYENVFVFEDDAKILTQEFVEVINKCIEQLPEDYDLLYSGCNLHGKCERYSENLLSVKDVYSSHAILYSRKAVEKILPKLKAATIYDTLLAKQIQPQGHCYCTYPLLVSQSNGHSDIANKTVNYERLIEKKYREKTKNL